jgi:hypothetical protein
MEITVLIVNPIPIVAKKAYGLESGKEQTDGYKSRPESAPFSGELLACAQQLSRAEDWKRRTADGAATARVFLGAIAASDKVIAGTDNPTFQRLKLHYNDTLALSGQYLHCPQRLQYQFFSKRQLAVTEAWSRSGDTHKVDNELQATKHTFETHLKRKWKKLGVHKTMEVYFSVRETS